MSRTIEATIRLKLTLPSSVSIDDLDARLPEFLASGFGSHVHISPHSPTLLAAADISSNQPLRNLPLHELLAETNQIAVTWEIDNV